jgi:FMN-dependent NADH-azoreductase
METEMTRILAITASPKSQGSITNALVARFLDQAGDKAGAVEIVRRDLGTNTPPHLDEATIGAFYTKPEDRTAEQRELIALSEDIVSELEAAEVIVIGAPMHNFTIPSALKTWIDHAARVGRTFHYTENGPVGLLEGKRVYVLSARGGNYREGTPAAAFDHQMPYLKTVLGFIGLNDVTFIQAHGVAQGAGGVAQAEEEVDQAAAALSDARKAA